MDYANEVFYCRTDKSIHRRDDTGGHEVFSHIGADQTLRSRILSTQKKFSNSYGRFEHGPDAIAQGEDAMGYGKVYLENPDLATIKTEGELDAYPHIGKRVPQQGMETAMEELFGVTSSATGYVKQITAKITDVNDDVADSALPLHRDLVFQSMQYNWCHLLGHGLGGKDGNANIVVATTHNNSEQLAIEEVLKEYTNEGISVSVVATLVPTTDHLAYYIDYSVSLGGFEVYTQRLDGARAFAPTDQEKERIQRNLRSQLNQALSIVYPVPEGLTL